MNRTDESTGYRQLKGYGRNKWDRSERRTTSYRFYTSCSRTRTNQVYHASAQFSVADLSLAVHDHACVSARGHA